LKALVQRLSRGVFGLLIAASFFAAPAVKAQAKTPTSLSTKVEGEFRAQNFEKVIALLEPALEDSSKLDMRERVKFLERLGACYWLTDKKEAARSTFARLWQDAYAHELDELVYPAQLLGFYAAEKRRLSDLGFIGKPTSDTEKPGEDSRTVKTVIRTVTNNRAPALAYLMPFGVGQFANGDNGLGTAIAILQGIGLLGNVATWISVEALKVGGSMPPERAGQADLLQGLWIGSTAVLAAAYVYSVVDGFMDRPPERVVTESNEADVGLQLRVTPALQGLGVGLGGTF